VASKTSAFLGIFIFEPTALIFPFFTIRVPLFTRGPEIGIIVPPLMASV
ncbi:uncharacterized protein METZ01_LOCUS146610, partial [marine metagenome]